MQTSSQSSKKCSTAETLATAFAIAAVSSVSLFSYSTFATPAPPSVRELRSDLRGRTGTSFETLIQRWQSRHGARAVAPLLSIASDTNASDADRYVSLMSAAKLGGAPSAPSFTRYLRDRSWMIRSAALKALSALQNPNTASSVIPLMKDPALVVRLEAIHAVESLKPEGSVTALVEALEDPSNYHRGRAQWVPQRALEAITKLRAKAAVPRVRPLLAHKDPGLRAAAAVTLKSLE